MLVLCRKVDEDIVIGSIRVKVIEIAGAKVRLGIEAPDDVCIKRGELLGAERVDEEVADVRPKRRRRKSRRRDF